MNKSLEAIVGAHPGVEKLAGEFGFTEGPVWVQPGFLLFSDLPNNAIMRWHPQESVSEFRKPSGCDANNATPGAHIGSNCLTLDSEGRLIIFVHHNLPPHPPQKDRNTTLFATP